MAQVFWEQIVDTLPELGEHLTGSLNLSGSFNISGGLTLDNIDILTIIEEHSGIFKETGSYWTTTNDLQITGSLFIELDGIEDEFTISIGGSEKLKVNTQGILQIVSQSGEPTPITGGLYLSNDDNFYLGFNN